MLGSMVILVADDDNENDFDLTQRALRNSGPPSLLSARNLQEAREQMVRPDISVMLLDRMIPVDDRTTIPCTLVEWGDFIKEASVHCAVIIYTGHVSIADQEKATNKGAVDYLNKSWCWENQAKFAERIASASDFYARKKMVVQATRQGTEEIISRLESDGREMRMQLGSLTGEFLEQIGRERKESLKAAHRAGRQQQKALDKAMRYGRETFLWGWLVWFIWHGWGYIQVGIAFIRGILQAWKGIK